MRIFDTKVQHLKYKVLREVARYAWQGTLTENLMNIPKIIVPGKTPTMRCCIYKEQAIVSERVKLAMGGNPENKNVIEVIDIACDECPMGGYEVTGACRGCLAHRCEDVCKKGAITIDANQKAHIDKDKCVECGLCAKVCPYSAIINHKRPCEQACKVKAISMNENKAAKINDEKCISCGACVYQGRQAREGPPSQRRGTGRERCRWRHCPWWGKTESAAPWQLLRLLQRRRIRRWRGAPRCRADPRRFVQKIAAPRRQTDRPHRQRRGSSRRKVRGYTNAQSAGCPTKKRR